MATRSWCLRVALVALLASAAVASSSSSSSSSSSDDDGADSIPALSAMDTYDVVGIVFMACGLAISSAGGVGGGVIMVPAMVLIMSFDIKRATPISNMAILGGAVANAWFNLRKRHPVVDRPLVDSDLSLAMIPVVIGGAVIGAVLSKLLPSYLISLLFVVVLAGSGTRTMQKGIKLHKKERAAKEKADAEAAAAAVTGDGDALPSPTTDKYTEVLTPTVPEQASASEKAKESGYAAAEESKEEVLARILDKERSIAWHKQAVIVLCYLGIVASSILDKVVDCGGAAYWVLLLVEIPWVAAFAVLTSVYLLKDHRRKLSVDYQFAAGDVQWTKKTVIWFPLGCAVAGVIAGLFGVGGAIITGPMIIEIGVVPEVASATSALMVLFSSAAATAKFAVFDMISWDWAGLLCGIAFVVTSASQVVILGYVRKTGKQSIIVLCIGVSIVIGAALMTYQSIKSTIDSYDDPFSVDVCT